MQTKRIFLDSAWTPGILLMIPFIAMIAATGMNFRLIGDEKIYIRVIEQFAIQWPAPDIHDYEAGSAPLTFLILTAFGKLAGFEIWKLRLLLALVNYCAIYAFYKLAKQCQLPYPLLSTFVFLFFPYIFFHGFTVYNESFPLLFLICALRYFLQEKLDERSLLKGSILMTLAAYCRQTYLVVPAAMVLYEIWSNRARFTFGLFGRIAILAIPLLAFIPLFLFWGGVNPPYFQEGRHMEVVFSRTNFVAIFVGSYFLPWILESVRLGWRWVLLHALLLPAYFLAVPRFEKSDSVAAQFAAITGLTMHAVDLLRNRLGKWTGDVAQLLLWLSGVLILSREIVRVSWDPLKTKLMVMLGVFVALITMVPTTTERYFTAVMPILTIQLHRRFERRSLLLVWLLFLISLSVVFAVWQIKFKSFAAWGDRPSLPK